MVCAQHPHQSQPHHVEIALGAVPQEQQALSFRMAGVIVKIIA
jgi:hypothetical protein